MSPFDTTHFLTPSPHQNRRRRARVEKVGLGHAHISKFGFGALTETLDFAQFPRFARQDALYQLNSCLDSDFGNCVHALALSRGRHQGELIKQIGVI
jgi:hypothetical protein